MRLANIATFCMVRRVRMQILYVLPEWLCAIFYLSKFWMSSTVELTLTEHTVTYTVAVTHSQSHTHSVLLCRTSCHRQCQSKLSAAIIMCHIMPSPRPRRQCQCNANDEPNSKTKSKSKTVKVKDKSTTKKESQCQCRQWKSVSAHHGFAFGLHLHLSRWFRKLNHPRVGFMKPLRLTKAGLSGHTATEKRGTRNEKREIGLSGYTASILIEGCVFLFAKLVCAAILPRVYTHVAPRQNGKMAAHTSLANKKRILRLKYLRSKYRLELWAWCKSNILHRNAQLFVHQFCEHTTQSVPSGGKLPVRPDHASIVFAEVWRPTYLIYISVKPFLITALNYLNTEGIPSHSEVHRSQHYSARLLVIVVSSRLLILLPTVTIILCETSSDVVNFAYYIITQECVQCMYSKCTQSINTNTM